MRRLLTRDRSFYRTLVALAVPVALQQLITFAVNLADNLMVGSLGDSAVSGVYTAGQIQTFLQLFSGGIEGAILILAAQYWGKRDVKRIREIAAVGLRFSLVCGLALTAVCMALPEAIVRVFTTNATVIRDGALYLRIVSLSYVFFCVTQALIAATRAVEEAKIGMIVSSISLCVNIVMNYVLIFGLGPIPALGIAGAAWATLASRVTETAVMIVYMVRFDRELHLTLRDITARGGSLVKDFIRCALPLLGGNVVWSVNMMASTAILGRFEPAVITAVSVANTLNNICYVSVNGMASAVGIITGKTIGAGQRERMKEYAYTVQILFPILGVLVSLLLFITRGPFIALYGGISAEAAVYAMQFIGVLCITVIGSSYQAPCLFGLVKSGGDISFVFKNDTIFVFLVVLPSALIAAKLGLPAWVVFACLKCDQVLKCFVAVIKINRFNWMKDLTRAA